MNMVLVQISEVDCWGAVVITGRRCDHINKILRLKVGDSFKIGVLDGRSGIAEITEISGASVKACCSFNAEPSDLVRIDVILAMPRPKVMKRLWAPLAMLGIGRIFIINADKVEKYYFDTHVLDVDFYESRLVDGLEQSCRTVMPKVSIGRTVTPDSAAFFTQFAEYRKVLAMPASVKQLDAVRSYEKLVIAIGPEGGWTDRELNQFAGHGFETISLGPTPLKVDVAAISLISVAAAMPDSSVGIESCIRDS